MRQPLLTDVVRQAETECANNAAAHAHAMDCTEKPEDESRGQALR